MDLNWKNTKSILLIITFTLALYTASQNIKEIQSGLSSFYSLMSPIILGLAMAFVINIFMKGIEKYYIKIFSKGKKNPLLKHVRGLSILSSIAVVFIILAIVGLVVLPEIGNLATTLLDVLPNSVEVLFLWVEEQLLKFNIDLNAWIDMDIDWSNTIKNFMTSFMKSSSAVLNTATAVASNILAFLTNFIIALVLAIYILASKEKVTDFTRDLSRAALPSKVHAKLLKLTRLSSEVFSKFVIGQLTEAVILGTLCFIGMVIFRFPYAMVVSVFLALTALIPIVGAFLGGAMGFVLIFVVSPVKAVFFIIYITVLQQLEGNLIYPKVVGKSIGLPSIIVLTAIVIGGNAYGIIGMLFAVPVSAIIYTLLLEFVAKKS